MKEVLSFILIYLEKKNDEQLYMQREIKQQMERLRGEEEVKRKERINRDTQTFFRK